MAEQIVPEILSPEMGTSRHNLGILEGRVYESWRKFVLVYGFGYWEALHQTNYTQAYLSQVHQ